MPPHVPGFTKQNSAFFGFVTLLDRMRERIGHSPDTILAERVVDMFVK
jgi:hypothetical protein